MSNINSQKNRKLKYMPIVHGISYNVNNRKLQFLNFSLKWFFLEKLPDLADKLFYLEINERLGDYAFVHQNINLDGKGKILDVGCYGSKLVLELATLGYESYGIDIMDYIIKHPNFKFIQGDICNTSFKNDFFDVVTAISTIEHIGLGRYDDLTHPDGDHQAIKEIDRILKPNGKAIITVPFGKSMTIYKWKIPLHKVYNLQTLENLFSDTGLKIIKFITLAKKEGIWIPIPSQEAEYIENGEVVICDALIVAQKVD